MKYYEVTAKCGHVGGKTKFISKDFYTCANNGKEAAKNVRYAARVKHDHKDAIQNVREISFAEYLAGKKAFWADPYNLCSNAQQQLLIWDEIAEQVQDEPVAVDYTESRKNDGRPNAKRSLKYGYDAYGKSARKSAWYYAACA